MFPIPRIASNNLKRNKSGKLTNAEKIYQMLTPKPKALLEKERKLVRHGELIYFSPNTMSKKPRYFFLFEDCLLIAKRTGSKKFLLRLWMYLRAGVKIYPMRDSPNHEFRLLVPIKGSVRSSKQRRLIMFGTSKQQKEDWIRDLAYCLWNACGKKGPDPSGKTANPHVYAKHGGDDGEDMKEGLEESDEDEAKLRKPAKGDKAGNKDKDAAAKAGNKEKDADKAAKGDDKKGEKGDGKGDDDDEDLSYESASDDEEPVDDSAANSGDLLVLFEPDSKDKKEDTSASASTSTASTGTASTSTSTTTSATTGLDNQAFFQGFDPFKSGDSAQKASQNIGASGSVTTQGGGVGGANTQGQGQGQFGAQGQGQGQFGAQGQGQFGQFGQFGAQGQGQGQFGAQGQGAQFGAQNPFGLTAEQIAAMQAAGVLSGYGGGAGGAGAGYGSGGFPLGGQQGGSPFMMPGSGGFPQGQLVFTPQGVPVWVPAQFLASMSNPQGGGQTATQGSGSDGAPSQGSANLGANPFFSGGFPIQGQGQFGAQGQGQFGQFGQFGAQLQGQQAGQFGAQLQGQQGGFSTFGYGNQASPFTTSLQGNASASTSSSSSSSSSSSGSADAAQKTSSTTNVSSASEGQQGFSNLQNVKFNEMKGEDLDLLAQKELEAALSAIENLTRQLEARPRKVVHKTSTESTVTFDDVSDAILNATQAISSAATILLKAATNAQRERAESGISSTEGGHYNADPVWAQGLISAARFVVAATQNLVLTADAVIKGKEKQEKLVAAAGGVSAATAQLVAAHRAKADAKQKSSTDLEAAANGITKATAKLVHAAQMAITPVEVEDTIKTDERFTLTEINKKKFETSARVLELERETEKARQELQNLNKQQYKGA